jgi:hypothetical protein
MVWVIEHNIANTVMTDQIHAEYRTCENNLLDARTQIAKLQNIEHTIRGDMQRKEEESSYLRYVIVSIACLIIAILSYRRQ